MATQEELDKALDQLDGDIADVAKQVNDGFARLEAKISQGASPTDLSAEVKRLSDTHAKLMEVIASAQAEAPAGETPAAGADQAGGGEKPPTEGTIHPEG